VSLPTTTKVRIRSINRPEDNNKRRRVGDKETCTDQSGATTPWSNCLSRRQVAQTKSKRAIDKFLILCALLLLVCSTAHLWFGSSVLHRCWPRWKVSRSCKRVVNKYATCAVSPFRWQWLAWLAFLKTSSNYYHQLRHLGPYVNRDTNVGESLSVVVSMATSRR